MNATSFDTLAAADKLRKAGFDDAHVRAIVDIHRAADDRVATKTDLAMLRTDLAGLETRMYRAMWIQGGAIVAILTAPRFLPV